MGELVTLHQSARRFTLEETRRLLPLIERITQNAVGQFLVLEEKLKHHQNEPERWKQIEAEIGDLLNRWSHKIMHLGALPKGIWLVDFDNGQGYYCWRYGDREILYFHGYQEGFSGRVAVQ